MTNNRNLSVILDLDRNRFSSSINQAHRELRVFAGQFGVVGNTIYNVGNIALKTLPLITAGLTAVGLASVKAAGQFEDFQTNFKVFLGSATLAKQMLMEIKDIADSTPFTFPELTTATTQLVSYGVSQDEVLEKLKMLGDFSQGNAEKLNLIAYAYGQIASLGKARLQELNQLTNNSVPIIKLLGEAYNKTSKQIYKMSEEGKISFQMVDEALKKSTSYGGLFFNMMDEKSKTLFGRLSTLRDHVGGVALALGNEMLPSAKLAVDQLDKLVLATKTSIEKLIKFEDQTGQISSTLKDLGAGLAIAGGTVAAVMGVRALFKAYDTLRVQMALGAAQSVILANIMQGNMSLAFTQVIDKIKVFTRVSIIATITNPWVLLAVAISGVGFALYQMTKNAESASDQLKRLKKISDDTAESSRTEANSIHELIKKYNKLSSEKIKNASINLELKNTKQKLIDKFPTLRKEIDESIKKYGKLTDAVKNSMSAILSMSQLKPLEDAYTKAQIENIKAKEKYTMKMPGQPDKIAPGVKPIWDNGLKFQKVSDIVNNAQKKEDQARQALLEGAKRIKEEVSVGIDTGAGYKHTEMNTGGQDDDGKNKSLYNIPKGQFELEKFRKDLAEKNKATLDSINDEQAKLVLLAEVRDYLDDQGISEKESYYGELETLLVNSLDKTRELTINSEKETNDAILKLKEKLQSDILSIEGGNSKNKDAAIAALKTKEADEENKIKLSKAGELNKQLKALDTLTYTNIQELKDNKILEENKYRQDQAKESASILKQIEAEHEQERVNKIYENNRIIADSHREVAASMGQAYGNAINGILNHTMTGAQAMHSILFSLMKTVAGYGLSSLINSSLGGFSGNTGAFLSAFLNGVGVPAFTGAGTKQSVNISKNNPLKLDTGGVLGGKFSQAIPIIAHGQEMILNPKQQSNLFNLIQNGYTGNNQQQMQQAQPVLVNFNIQAFDSRDVQAYLVDNKHIIQGIIGEAVKNNNGGLRSVIKGV